MNKIFLFISVLFLFYCKNTSQIDEIEGKNSEIIIERKSYYKNNFVRKQENYFNGEKIGWFFEREDEEEFGKYIFYYFNKIKLVARIGMLDNSNYEVVAYYAPKNKKEFIRVGQFYSTKEYLWKCDTIWSNGYFIPDLLNRDFVIRMQQKFEMIFYLASYKWVDIYDIYLSYSYNKEPLKKIIDTTIHKKGGITQLVIPIKPEKKGVLVIMGVIIPRDTNKTGERLLNKYEWPFFMNYFVE